MQSWIIGEAKNQMLENMYASAGMMPTILIARSSQWGAMTDFACNTEEDVQMAKRGLSGMSIKKQSWLPQQIIDAYTVMLNKSRRDENTDVLCTSVYALTAEPSLLKKNSRCLLDLDNVEDLLIPCSVPNNGRGMMG